MKRREFLVASAGLAGSILPAVSRGQVKPCGPATVVAQGGSTAQVNCGVITGSAPSWFVAQPERTWKAVAAGGTLAVAYSSPTEQPGLNGGSFDITKAYNGACVDQARGEYLMAANGGHDNYRGNEVYACQIRSENPAWYRLLDRSPTSVVDPPVTTGSSSASSANRKDAQGHNPNGYAAMYRDGRMRAQHGWHNNVFANNRVWYPVQASTAGIGYSTSHAWCFDRGFPGLATEPGQIPLGWSNDAGPWEWLGTSDAGLKGDQSKSASFGTAPPAALDPVTGRIWYSREDYGQNLWASLDTSTKAIRSAAGSANPTSSSWAAVVVDPTGLDLWRFFVINCRADNTLAILNLKASNPYAASAWTRVAVSNPAVIRGGLGAVYHKASRSILLYDASDMRDASLYKLRVPTNPDGTYAGGTWQVSTVVAGSGSANPSTGVPTGGGNASGQYTWSKFNIVEDMGNGQSGLVVCMDTSQPVYVYKLPVQGV